MIAEVLEKFKLSYIAEDDYLNPLATEFKTVGRVYPKTRIGLRCLERTNKFSGGYYPWLWLFTVEIFMDYSGVNKCLCTIDSNVGDVPSIEWKVPYVSS